MSTIAFSAVSFHTTCNSPNHCHDAVTHAHHVVHRCRRSVWITADRDRHHQFTTLTVHLSWQHLRRSAIPEIWLVPTKILMVHMTWPCSFLGRIAIRELALAMINPSTKFDISISIQYEDIKGDRKCRKWSGLGVARVIKGHWK